MGEHFSSDIMGACSFDGKVYFIFMMSHCLRLLNCDIFIMAKLNHSWVRSKP